METKNCIMVTMLAMALRSRGTAAIFCATKLHSLSVCSVFVFRVRIAHYTHANV